MSGTPNGVLYARAIHFLELAQLQLKNGDVEDAARSIETAAGFLERVEA